MLGNMESDMFESVVASIGVSVKCVSGCVVESGIGIAGMVNIFGDAVDPPPV